MTVHPDRIRELLVPFTGCETLSQTQLKSLRTYLDLLLLWNSKMNLTSVRDPEEIVTRHFGESLFAARQLFPDPFDTSVIDIGSGAGFPGIPLKIWNQSTKLTLIESNGKRATFLREVIRALKLTATLVASTRAENLNAKGDVVTLRAVEQFQMVLPTAQNMLAANGRLALLIGEAQVPVAKSTLTDLNWAEPIKIPLSDNRALLIGSRA